MGAISAVGNAVSTVFVSLPVAAVQLLLRWFFLANLSLIILLLLPLPSNFLRSIIVRIVEFTWERLFIVQACSFALCALNCIVFVLALITTYALRARVRRQGIHLTCETRATYYASQRECYAAGYGLFTFFVAYRLLQIQVQLHKARQILLQKQRLRMSGSSPASSTKSI